MTTDGRAKTFEAKVTSLVEATRHLDVAQIVVLRRMTIADPQTRRWASEQQIAVVFDVILAKALERLGAERLEQARGQGFTGLLPPDAGDADRRLLDTIAERLLGPPRQASEAETTQASFEALLTRRLLSVPPKIERAHAPAKEAQPLFAAQLGADALKRGRFTRDPAAAPDVAFDDEKPFTNFPTLFDDTICAHVAHCLSHLAVSPRPPGERLPFLLAPEFSVLLQDVVRRFVLPPMRASRQIQSLANNYNWADVGGAQLIEIIHSGEVNNPILHHWDARWNAMRGKSREKPSLRGESPWQMFREDATLGNYEPPGEDDLQMVQDIIRFDSEALLRAWREIEQLYQQEFAPSGRQAQARDGAFRDGVLKWTSRLADHLGEFLAMRAYFMFNRLDMEFLRRLVTNFGRSDSERRRNAPYLCRFIERRGG
jgi:hypothetical protein